MVDQVIRRVFRCAKVTGVVAPLVAGSMILGGAPATGATPTPVDGQDRAALYLDAPPPTVLPAPRSVGRLTSRSSRAASQCSGYLWTPAKSDVRQAEDIMSGWFKLDRYGYMRVKSNPNWRNQGSLNSSGNGHQHSLYWALPLLRVGLSNGRPDMVARFYAIVDDWLRDNPVRRPRSSAANGQIESGFRLITLACAVQHAGPRARRYLRAMRNQARYLVGRWRLVNNASFHQAAGIFAAGCVAGDARLRSRALSYLNWSASSLIMPDGSVLEGSLEYARATYVWTLEQINRLRGCGFDPPAGLARAELIPGFLAFGIRPDGKYEALGDGGAKEAEADDAPDDGAFQYAATGGERGSSPGSLYARFGAGFLFGRSGWSGGSDFPEATFYSLRTGAGPSQVYHAHADAGALTVHAGGSQLLFDAGPYFGYSELRGRSSHNLALLDGEGYGSPAPSILATGSDASGDLTTLVDRAYRRTQLVRTVWYDRVGDFFVVVDDVRQRKRARKVRSVLQNWNLGRDRKVEVAGSAAHSMGSGANVSVISVGGSPGYSVLRGSRYPWGGWNSELYSEVAPSPSIRVSGGRSDQVRLVTVVIPRAEGEDPSAVGAGGYLEGDGAVVAVTRGGVTHTVRVGRTAAQRL